MRSSKTKNETGRDKDKDRDKDRGKDMHIGIQKDTILDIDIAITMDNQVHMDTKT